MNGLRRRLPLLALLALFAVLIAPESVATTAAMHPGQPMPKRWQPPGLFITVYDWGLGGHNCYLTCTETALMIPTGDDLLGWTAACPSAWLGRITTTVVTIWGEEYWCTDSFGRPEDRVLTQVDGRPVYRIDLAFRPAGDHPWNMERVPYEEWSREWRPMTEFNALRAARAAELEQAARDAAMAEQEGDDG